MSNEENLLQDRRIYLIKVSFSPLVGLIGIAPVLTDEFVYLSQQGFSFFSGDAQLFGLRHG
jgi:hypothetical protein